VAILGHVQAIACSTTLAPAPEDKTVLITTTAWKQHVIINPAVFYCPFLKQINKKMKKLTKKEQQAVKGGTPAYLGPVIYDCTRGTGCFDECIFIACICKNEPSNAICKEVQACFSGCTLTNS
jgi:hypothetical protein